MSVQTVETVNESVQDRQRALDLLATGRDAEWRNRLIWGDKKYILPSLLSEFVGLQRTQTPERGSCAAPKFKSRDEYETWKSQRQK
jgi:hypothetical protein